MARRIKLLLIAFGSTIFWILYFLMSEAPSCDKSTVGCLKEERGDYEPQYILEDMIDMDFKERPPEQKAAPILHLNNLRPDIANLLLDKQKRLRKRDKYPDTFNHVVLKRDKTFNKNDNLDIRKTFDVSGKHFLDKVPKMEVSHTSKYLLYKKKEKDLDKLDDDYLDDSKYLSDEYRKEDFVEMKKFGPHMGLKDLSPLQPDISPRKLYKNRQIGPQRLDKMPKFVKNIYVEDPGVKKYMVNAPKGILSRMHQGKYEPIRDAGKPGGAGQLRNPPRMHQGKYEPIRDAGKPGAAGQLRNPPIMHQGKYEPIRDAVKPGGAGQLRNPPIMHQGKYEPIRNAGKPGAAGQLRNPPRYRQGAPGKVMANKMTHTGRSYIKP